MESLEVQLASVIFQERKASDRDILLTFEMASKTMQLASIKNHDTSAEVYFKASFQGKTFVLGLRKLRTELLSAELAEWKLDTLPSELIQLFLEGLFTSYLDILEAKTQSSLILESQLNHPPVTHDCSYAFALQQGEDVVCEVILLGNKELEVFLDRNFTPQSWYFSNLKEENLAFTWQVNWGKMQISEEELNNISEGDVLIPDELWLQDKTTVHLGGLLSFEAVFNEGGQLILVELKNFERSKNSLKEPKNVENPEDTERIFNSKSSEEGTEEVQEVETEQAGAESVSVSEVVKNPVPTKGTKAIMRGKLDLYFSINLGTNRFNELDSIKPGEKVFAFPEQTRICILKDQSVLGFGQKVQLGQQVAVRITDWLR